jgi:hypothetical protein
MMNKIFSYGSLVLLATAGIACGKGTSATEASFCAQKAEKECGTDSKGVAVSCGATLAACKAARAEACAAWIPTQESATRPFRPENIGNCLTKTADAYSSPTVVPSKRAAMDEACARVFSGRGTVLTACASSYDCAADLICDPTLNICAKKVTSNTTFCNDPGSVCPVGQYCAPTGAVRSCVADKIAGQVCSPTEPCAAGLRCSGGVCTAKVGVNLACGSDDDCAADAPYCDGYNGCLCRPGFMPTIGAPECGAFGATAVPVAPQVCSSAGGAGGSPGTAGTTGAAGAAGGAGGEGVGGAGGAG